MVEHKIASTLKIITVTITGSWWVLNDGKDEKYHKHINLTIVSGNVMDMYLIIMEGNYGAIDDDDSSFHGYCII